MVKKSEMEQKKNRGRFEKEKEIKGHRTGEETKMRRRKKQLSI